MRKVAEYTKCTGCNTSLLLCNCPKCGKIENCIRV